MDEWTRGLIIVLMIGFSIFLVIILPNLSTNSPNNDSISSSIIEPQNNTQNIKQNETQDEKALGLFFHDNMSNCTLNGNVILNGNPMGKTSDGNYDLTSRAFNSYANSSGQNDLCIDGTLDSCFGNYSGWVMYRCWYLPTQDFYEQIDYG